MERVSIKTYADVRRQESDQRMQYERQQHEVIHRTQRGECEVRGLERIQAE